MNKNEVIREVSEKTAINATICTRVINSIEIILSDELEKSEGVKNAFDKIYNLLNIIKEKDTLPIFKEDEFTNRLVRDSETTREQCLKIVNVLIDILNNKIEVSKSAKMKLDIVYKLVNFFKH